MGSAEFKTDATCFDSALRQRAMAMVQDHRRDSQDFFR